jgi:hypothetical protein
MLTGIFAGISGEIRRVQGQANKWVIVMFSECFFSSSGRAPLKSSEILEIVNKCIALTRDHPNVIVHATFLHAFKLVEDDDATIENIGDCNWLASYSYYPQQEKVEERIKDGKSLQLFNRPDSSLYHVAKYSLIIWNRKPIAIYRKGTHCGELRFTEFGNDNRKWCYEFGDYFCHGLINEDFRDAAYKKMANVFTRQDDKSAQIITRICSDMNNNGYLETYDENAKLLLLPGNSTPSRIKGCNGLKIIHADDDRAGVNLKIFDRDNRNRRSVIRRLKEIPCDINAQPIDQSSGINYNGCVYAWSSFLLQDVLVGQSLLFEETVTRTFQEEVTVYDNEEYCCSCSIM